MRHLITSTAFTATLETATRIVEIGLFDGQSSTEFYRDVDMHTVKSAAGRAYQYGKNVKSVKITDDTGKVWLHLVKDATGDTVYRVDIPSS